MRSHILRIFAALLALAAAAGCGQLLAAPPVAPRQAPASDSAAKSAGAAPWAEPAVGNVVSIGEEAVPLSGLPAASSGMLSASAPGTETRKNEYAVIDYSNTADGYVMVKYTASTGQRLKVQVKGPTTTYTYNLTRGQWTVFPLSDGNGSYQIAVYQNVTADKYAAVLSFSTSVKLKNEFAPFLRPNQYVDYSAGSKTVAKAAELAGSIADPLQKIAAVYDYVVGSLSYDRQKAATVQSGYLPVLDNVLAAKKGICFDYAALMTGMLRSQGIPCKLVVGYAGQVYHAWISVWTEGSGWIDGAIFFDGVSWHRMDPTFASSGGQSDSIMSYIGDGKNYTVKYLY